MLQICYNIKSPVTFCYKQIANVPDLLKPHLFVPGAVGVIERNFG